VEISFEEFSFLHITKPDYSLLTKTVAEDGKRLSIKASVHTPAWDIDPFSIGYHYL
jgi:hypothetical protein